MSEDPTYRPISGQPQDGEPSSVARSVPPGVDGGPEGAGDQITEPPLGRTDGFLPPEPARGSPESVLVRVVATAGIVGIGTALGAILVAADVAGWIVGLVVSLVSVVLAALLWRSRTL